MDDRKTRRLSITLPNELHHVLETSSQENERSLNGEIVYALRQYVKAQEKAKTK